MSFSAGNWWVNLPHFFRQQTRFLYALNKIFKYDFIGLLFSWHATYNQKVLKIIYREKTDGICQV
jgi:hypothetical protein